MLAVHVKRWILCVVALLLVWPIAYSTSAQSAPKRNCGNVSGAKLYLYGDVEGMTPHAIADDFMTYTLLPLLSDDLQAVWPYLVRERGDVDGAVEAWRLTTGEARALSAEDLDSLHSLREVHETIVAFEGTRLEPDEIALLLSLDWNDWRSKYMTRDSYVAQFLVEAKRRMGARQIPSYAAAMEAAQLMLNRLDDLHGAAGHRTPPEDAHTLSLWDSYTRRKAIEPRINHLISVSQGESYWREWLIMRDWTLRCVGQEARSWKKLDDVAIDGIPVSAALENGAWCSTRLSVKYEVRDLNRLLEEEVYDETLKEVYGYLREACSEARWFKISASVDNGHALVLPYWIDLTGEEPAYFVSKKADEHRRFLRLLSAAQEGDVAAMGDIAMIYEVSEALPRDYGAAFEWLKKSAEGGSSLSQAELARYFAKGLGTYRDRKAAFFWADKSASQGNPLGLNQRAFLGYPGSSIERFLETYKDGSLVAELLRPAIDLELAVAQCESPKYANDTRYETICPNIRASRDAMKRPVSSAASGQDDFGGAMEHFNQITLEGLQMSP